MGHSLGWSRGQRSDFINSCVDGLLEFPGKQPLGFLSGLAEFFEFIVEKHPSQCIKYRHTSFGLAELQKLTCFVQVAGKRDGAGRWRLLSR